MTRLLVLVALSALLVPLSAGCSTSNKSWQEAENAASAFLDALREKRFADSFEMWDPETQFGARERRSDYIQNYQGIAYNYPGFFDWKLPDLERHKAETRVMVYAFKVTLEFKKGDPIKEAEAKGMRVPFFQREMYLSVTKRGGKWYVTRFKGFNPVDFI